MDALPIKVVVYAIKNRVIDYKSPKVKTSFLYTLNTARQQNAATARRRVVRVRASQHTDTVFERESGRSPRALLDSCPPPLAERRIHVAHAADDDSRVGVAAGDCHMPMSHPSVGGQQKDDAAVDWGDAIDDGALRICVEDSDVREDAVGPHRQAAHYAGLVHCEGIVWHRLDHPHVHVERFRMVNLQRVVGVVVAEADGAVRYSVGAVVVE